VEFVGLSSEGATTNTCALAMWLSSRADMVVFVSRHLLRAPVVRQSPVESPPLVNALSDAVTGEHVA
jgi:signal recognition particle GTPase